MIRRAFAAFFALTTSAQACTNYVCGAIRWDAWAATPNSKFCSLQAQEDLGPSQWQTRAPACATRVSPFAMSFANCNTQAAMDAEITAAHHAGLNFWAYAWYGTPEADSNPFQNAWMLHQSSSIRNNMNWALIFQVSSLQGATPFSNAFTTLTGYMAQTNYQTVLGKRPLVFILADQAMPRAFRSNWSIFANSLRAFRSASIGAGLGNPYIVLQQGVLSTATAASTMTTIDADALGAYATPNVASAGGAAYTQQVPSDRNFWAKQAAAAATIVPTLMTGWDTRPRKQNPSVCFGSGAKSGLGSNVYVSPSGSPGTDIATSFSNAFAYIKAHPSAVPSRVVLAYSWNENDEGGMALNPTWRAGNLANWTLLNALSTTLLAN